MPASLRNQHDDWAAGGHPLYCGGVSRGTTTSTGIATVQVSTHWGGPIRDIWYGWASDEAAHFRRADTAALGGTMATYLVFQFQTPNYPYARFRVRNTTLSAGGTQSSFTLATSAPYTMRYLIVGV